MRDMLHNPALHRRLKQAVRKHCPQDWKASRRHRRARLFSRENWHFKWLMILAATLCAGYMLAAPSFFVKGASMPAHQAAGLVGLHVICASVFVGMMMSGTPAVLLSPLINMPVSLNQMYQHVLDRHLMHILRIAAGALVVFLTAFAMPAGLLPVEDGQMAMWRVLGASLLCLGPTLGLAWLLHLVLRLAGPLPQPVRRLLALIPLSVAGIIIWELAHAFTRMIPAPGIMGEMLAWLPTAELCEWVRGHAFPWQAVLMCLAVTVLSLWRLQDLLRDTQPEFDEDHIEQTPICTAEAVLATLMKERRVREGWPRAASQASLPVPHHDHMCREDEAEIDDAAVAPEDGEYPSAFEYGLESPKGNLFLHEAAPKEHNTPASPEFRAAMATKLQRLLDEPPEASLIQQVLSLKGPEPPARKVILRRALMIGIVPLVLLELEQYVPNPGLDMPKPGLEWLEFAFFAGALLIGVGQLLWLTLWNPVMDGIGLNVVWPKLPWDGSQWLSAYTVLEKSWLRWRCQFALIALGAWALTCGLIGGLKGAIGLQTGLIQLSMLYYGALSLPSMALLLLGLIWGVRCMERWNFVKLAASTIQWRGIWRPWLMLHLILQLTSGVMMSLVVLWGWVMISANEWNSPLLWAIVPMLLIAIGIRWAAYWLAIGCLRHGRGSVK